MEKPSTRNEGINQPETDYQYIEQSYPSLYNHRIFVASGMIFDSLKYVSYERKLENQEGYEIPQKQKKTQIYLDNMDLDSDKEKRLAFELAFNALKYQSFLLDLLEKVQFFAINTELVEAGGIVMVMLYDLQSRKFQRWPRRTSNQQIEQIREIEDCLISYRTKMNAVIARMRIKAQSRRVESLLPQRIRINEPQGDGKGAVHVWINQHKTSVVLAIDQLNTDGFRFVSSSHANLGADDFCRDVNCPDVLTFHPGKKEFLMNHKLVRSGLLVLQDKSSCIGAHSLKALLNDGDDILMVNIGSGLTAAQLSSLTHPSETHIFACGVRSDTHMKQVSQKLDFLGASNVTPLQEDFIDIDPDHPRCKHIKVIFVVANCTRSGVVNPVDFIVNEGEDVSILKSLSLGEQDDDQLGDLVAQQCAVLKHALTFPKCQAVVYFTRSVNKSENEHIVGKVVHYVNSLQHRKSIYKMSPPTIPLTDRDIENGSMLTHQGRFLCYAPSYNMNGCFISVITREAEDPKEAAKDILARAAAKGLLGNSVDIKLTKTEKIKPEMPHFDKRESLPLSTEAS